MCGQDFLFLFFTCDAESCGTLSSESLAAVKHRGQGETKNNSSAQHVVAGLGRSQKSPATECAAKYF